MALTSRNAGQKIFAQLLITVIFYSLICIIFEAVEVLDEILDNASVVLLISILNIINYLPEISLPLMLMVSALKFSKNLVSTAPSTSNR
ncbi:unnamed protein product [Caenorhabditis angaria]|uniref:Uncharacterized protein n=1 Tax=Caenorhabditis angaria TaxID=860376 RepID=A0A9P1MYQ1_9PELO|nr:unnamed protein product [Caenorhabditis angaria]